mmetsp:Transcript_2371/g.5280  ORF Transcript_2371/g.5280 Transcript_2371/m.5280 type:complete len:92 (+) Transcript_2371:1241-1516(+)
MMNLLQLRGNTLSIALTCDFDDDRFNAMKGARACVIDAAKNKDMEEFTQRSAKRIFVQTRCAQARVLRRKKETNRYDNNMVHKNTKGSLLT